MKVARFLLLVLFVGLLGTGRGAETGDEPAYDDPANGFLELYKADRPAWASTLDPFATQWAPGPFVWSSFYGQMERGPHLLQTQGSLSTIEENLHFEDDLLTGMFQSSVTYRYRGLFGGVVRPVARFTAGTGQYWGMPQTGGFSGYPAGLYSYAVPEAGVEIVFRYKGHGYGVGITGGYRMTVDMEIQRIMWDDEYTGGPFDPTRGDNFGEWFANVYPIFE